MAAVPVLEGLYAGPGQEGSLRLLRDIFDFLRANGQGHFLDVIPSLVMGGPPIDLIALYEAMVKRGGVQRVQEKGLLEELIAELGYSYDRPTCYTITLHYKNYLYAYEQAVMFKRRVLTRSPPSGG
ncbi:unnamed protein product, partial [Discosporangium mesarthrocarpum]